MKVAPYSVSGPGGEDAQLVAARLVLVRRRGEDDFGALGPADPVGLHDPDRLGPFEAGEVEQLVGVLRGAQVPLLQLALLDARAAAPAVAVGALDLLARQRAVVGAPVDRRLGAVGQPRFEEPQEDPLVPAVVLGVAGDDLARSSRRSAPIERSWRRMFSMFFKVHSRGLILFLIAAFSAGRPKASKPIGRKTFSPFMRWKRASASVGVFDVPVPDVQVSRRVRVHRQQVVLGPRRRRPGPCRTGRAPPSAAASAARWPRARSGRCGCALCALVPTRLTSQWVARAAAILQSRCARVRLQFIRGISPRGISEPLRAAPWP